MLKKIVNGLDAISIMSWVVTLIVALAIWYVTSNDVSFKWALNDLSRSYDSHGIISMLNKVIVCAIVSAGTTNLFSIMIRKLTDKTTVDHEMIDEFEKEEA